MLPDAETLSQILGALYEAPFDPTRWEEFLRLAAGAAGGEAAALLLHDFSDSQSLVARQWGIDPEATRRYEEYYGAVDVWRQRVSASPLRLGTSEQFLAFSELDRTEFYNDLLTPYGIPHAIFGVIEKSASRVATLSVYRGLAAGAFGENSLSLVRFLEPHIKRAYRLHSELSASRNRGDGLQSALDSLTASVILLANKGQVVTMNRAAERLLLENDGLSGGRTGLRCRRAAETARLERLVADASATSAGNGLNAAGVLSVSRRDRPPLQVLVSPVRGFDADEARPVRAIVFVSDPARRVRPAPETLRILFGLTPAECRLAMLLADGHSPSAIGEKLGVSRNTLKSQLASIYRKTDTSRQAQLVRLLLQLPEASPNL
jgi:DNA-binding CsgD family transcriptional regulator